LTIGAITLDSTFTGLVTLTGANTVTGPTTIQGGVLKFSADNQLGVSAISLNGGTLRVNTNTATITNSHVITVGASGGTINLEKTSGATFTFIMGNAGNLTGSGTLTLTAGGSLVHGTGATDMVLGNANSGYTGNMILQDGGILEYANTGGVGTGATFTVGNNGELSTFVTLSNAVTLNSGSTLAFQNNNSGVFSGAIALNGDASVRLRDWYGTTNRNGTISNTITGAHTINVNSGGDLGTGSTLTLAGFDAKASSADIVMDSASLAINSSAGTAAASVTRGNSLTIKTGNLTVAGVASQNTNDVFGTLNLANGSSGNQQGYSTWTITPNAATNAALTFTNMGTRTSGSWVAINGTIGATPAANTANIFFTNAPSGSNLIGSGGSLASGTASVIPWMHDTGGGNIYGYDATVGVAPVTTVNVNPDLATAGQNINWNAASTLTADRSINSIQAAFSGIDLGGHTLTVTSGVVTADNASFSNGTLDFGTAEGQVQVHQARTLTINSAISGSGGLTFVGFRTNSGNKGNLVLGGANTFTGVTNFWGYGAGANANLSLTNSLALQNSTLNNVAGRANQLNFGNGGTSGQTAYTFGGLTGNNNINLNNNNTTVGAVALTIGSAGSADTASTVNTYSGVLSSTVAGGSIIKDGVATEVFSGANTYDGGTTITNGKLSIINTSGSGTGTGAVAVSGGTSASLQGTGTATGLVTVTNASRLAPGVNISGTNTNFGAAGTLNLAGGLTLTSANLDFDLASTAAGTSDQLALGSGGLTFGAINFNFNGLGGTLETGAAYTLITTSGSSTGFDTNNITTSLLGSLAGNYTANYSLSGNNLQVTFTAVPEPSASALAVVGLLGMMLFLRRKRART
jgi:autotransporter-associated beta strand protein